MCKILPSNFCTVYKAEVLKSLRRSADMSLLSDADMKHLPVPVQKYLHYVGAVGRPKVQNFRARCTGVMRFTKDNKWMAIRSQQYDFFDDPASFFYIESTLYGIPFDGLHMYRGPNASMQINVASLIRVVDAKGPKMNQGETVTLFNDMCWLAPATLIERNIQRETVGLLTVRAKFTNQGNP